MPACSAHQIFLYQVHTGMFQGLNRQAVIVLQLQTYYLLFAFLARIHILLISYLNGGSEIYTVKDRPFTTALRTWVSGCCLRCRYCWPYGCTGQQGAGRKPFTGYRTPVAIDILPG